LPQINGTVFGWEFDLRIKLSMVQSMSLTFDPMLVKTSEKPQIPAKKACIAPNKKVSWPSLMH